MTEYAESYILGQQLSLVRSGRLAPRARQGKLLTQSRPDQYMVKYIFYYYSEFALLRSLKYFFKYQNGI